MGLFWLIVAICVIVGQFFIDNLIKKKKRKRVTAIIVLALTIIALIFSAFEQNRETETISEQLSKITLQHEELQTKLAGRDSTVASIRHQYDSLLFQNAVLQSSLANISKQQTESKSLGERTVEEVGRSREAIESIRQKSGVRSISNEVKANIVSILSSRKGRVSVSSVANNPEAHDLKVNLIGVLRASGWEVTDGLSYFTMPPRSGITIKVKGANYPKRAERIAEVLNLCNLKWAAQYDDNMADDDIAIMIDH